MGKKTDFLFFVSFIASGFLFYPSLSFAAGVDLGFSGQKDVWFGSQELISGQNVSLYARVYNFSDRDATGYITFFQGSIPIGDPQIVSVLAKGNEDHVFVDFTVPNGDFNILVKVDAVTPEDTQMSNNQVVTTLFTPKRDFDSDGVPDERDEDDDNDGLKDEDEVKQGTSVFNVDTDGDGYKDGDDAYPLDESKHAAPEPAPPVKEEKIEKEEQKPQQEQTSQEQNKPAAQPPKKMPLPAKLAVPKIEDVYEIEVKDGTAKTNQNKAEVQEDSDKVKSSVVQSEGEDEILEEKQVQDSLMSVLEYPSNIELERLTWNRYRFSLNGILAEDYGISWAWDFGDGTKGKGSSVEHEFPGFGTYFVSAAYAGEDDAREMEEFQNTVQISFFHLENPWLQGILGTLGFLLLFLMSMLLLIHKKEKDWQDISSLKMNTDEDGISQEKQTENDGYALFSKEDEPIDEGKGISSDNTPDEQKNDSQKKKDEEYEWFLRDDE